MICLGIESTAHTIGLALLTEKKQILSEVKDMYTTTKGGIIPLEAAKHHENIKDKLIKEVIEKSREKRIDLIAYSAGPGLAPCLRVGLKIAKELAEDLKVPLVDVNHIMAHLNSGFLFTEAKNPVFLFTSGANTQIVSLEGKRYRVFGDTIDIGMGNALDKFGREIGLGFPSGPKIEELAKAGKYIELPYTVKGMDLSFSGILTSAINKFKKGVSKEDLCFSIQETFFSMLTEVAERALAHTGKNEALLIGGVAANKRLCEMLGKMCKSRKSKFYAVPLKYSGDNAVMIAYQGILEYKNGRSISIDKADIRPYERIDQIEVFWK
ncbi:MAG: N(6)-L-threonylcarbamoyladenine synthase Kae1 [Nanoarchaeota archaeon]|nr:N(6)-L-threonylcarbamoyladenine synthase Kae1 [Nanoarchaeota archaeon]MBU0962482.1 N(6)-L-threonylcarbamoyladenine synthase Kae1 [Nanoarchaeota archaeon]